MINYKMFKSNQTINNCQSCDQTKTINRGNKISSNMNEIINSKINIKNIDITNFSNLTKNKLLNNKIILEYHNNNNNGCPNC